MLSQFVVVLKRKISGAFRLFVNKRFLSSLSSVLDNRVIF